ncbi:adenosylcobalamin-dependent ribonucleoside-diphosphate reductase [Clostridioides difficile]|uniref:adenosylcobalamin-dependent ribonucleoside-diphosphate reductase n=1 Tax=Clostridioides difficile TaxID=1496 RepID=UPI00038D2599|nr:adenosylcobalamin-dependent ribonucleoside-diphosphate reductase [Clostridioides difficile]EQF14852.1 ribonucleoside-diphosphate reductase, adenosylcobalamin-dependent [Clostridioides difficile CD133]EQH92639.1 ribonucleoside-diphosphate reductase, adenosylcobalamin-dependent [Clostridioides difficile F249]MBG0006290.1 adenosylcobalamin-dependent ribonucleoside-diphosphate reductase [Clostridioides difficile]MBG0010624.1 adenosylcobalamin-dependent ribonucleoside-diphosphate reductase [Clost
MIGWEMNEMQNAIWNNKYRNNNETFDEWLDRISNGDKEVRKLMQEKKFLFGGRILANRGLQKDGRKITYSNCYVLSTNDSIEDIYQTCSDAARTFSYGGGVGIDISKLRPRGAKVNNSAKSTTGAVSFMDTYSLVAETIGQSGRRAALMISLDINHPDIEEFIDIKTNLNKITKANISVRITDEFMQKATGIDSNPMYNCSFTREETGEIIVKEINAKELFNKLCENNWNYAEPGILFWDKINNYNLLSEDDEFEYAGVNPCAEEPLPAGGSCLLGSFNLSEYVKEDKTFNYNDFRKDIKIVVKAMNDVLDEGLPLHPLKIQRDTVRDYRQIGIGVMGIADMLIKMNVRYGSEMAIELCNVIGKCLADETLKQSALLSKKYGTYPKYKECILKSEFIQENASHETLGLIERYGLRNSQLLTIAPTGSISTMLGISGGIEPIFAFSYTRKTESLHDKEKYYKVYTPIVKKYMRENNIEDENTLPDYFVTATMLTPKERILMQSAFQKHIDASISSTVNLPYEATIEQVEELYSLAWVNGLKGLTIYRAGCKREGILTTNTINNTQELKRGDWKPVSNDAVLYKKELYVGCGKLILFISYSETEEDIQELYVTKAGSGGCEKLLVTATIAMSGMLRLGGTLDNIEKALRGVNTCPSFATSRAKGNILDRGSHCGITILNAVKDFLKEKQGEKIEESKEFKPKCPDCGLEIQMIEGCMTCPDCGWSKCN